MVRALEAGLSIKSIVGSGGMSRSLADSKKVVLGGVCSPSSFELWRNGASIALGLVDDSASLGLSARSVWLRLNIFVCLEPAIVFVPFGRNNDRKLPNGLKE